MLEPATAVIPALVYRVGRRRGLMHFSAITPEDAELPTAGNRYDVAGGAVLYAATEAVACYAETLSRFRPTPRMVALFEDGSEPGFMNLGTVPRDWRLQRGKATISVADPLPFLDVEVEILALGYETNLTISEICNGDRRLSRAIARYAYTASDDDGELLYSGIRYISKVHAGWECWAIFEGTQCDLEISEAIEMTDPDLQHVANMWGLTIFRPRQTSAIT